MRPFVVLEKKVGETPLSCVEDWRVAHTEYQNVPLAYAGRLDPMASGKLLVLIGNECKKQSEYHGLDKEYEFSILFGIASDTADVLGLLRTADKVPALNSDALQELAKNLVGDISLPYPHFSSKTVKGKPLHTWTVEGRLDEIEIPSTDSTIYGLKLKSLTSLLRTKAAATALEKIETIPPVTDLRKALGNDFRRADVRNDWNSVLTDSNLPETYQIATFRCICSSGTYMRSLSELLAKQAGTLGLAWHIHRTKIGSYNLDTKNWQQQFE